MKQIDNQHDWQRVAAELESEKLKLASYDKTLLERLGNVQGKKILDYGCGPGVLASALQRLGANVEVFDISPEMRRLCGEKIGEENVYRNDFQIPDDNFDHVICNLVMCIVSDYEAAQIARNIRLALQPDGKAYVGFCNPEIFDVPESALDLRFPTGHRYEENHSYKKLKKEGNYEITEIHRPLNWYENIFRVSGFENIERLFTPSYEMNGRQINDFCIFELSKYAEP